MKKLILATLMLVASHAWAWGDLGHSLVGAIAEDQMNENAKNFVRGILGVEPLATAAIWPDKVRDDLRFGCKDFSKDGVTTKNPLCDTAINDYAPYHFAEIPTGFTYNTLPVPDQKDAYGAMTGAIAILKDANKNREEKLIALRYLIHVTGDIHQPLHVGNGHDIGANVCYVYWQGAKETTNLHSVWDENLVNYLGANYNATLNTPPRKGTPYLGDFFTLIKKARPEQFTAENKKSLYGDGNIKKWLQEAQGLRENGAPGMSLPSGVYPDDQATMAGVDVKEKYMHRPYCLWFSDQVNGKFGATSPKKSDITKEGSKIPPNLDDAYATQMSKIVETQIIKGGLRLAALLEMIADTASAPKPELTKDQETTILTNVQNTFKNFPDPKK